MNEYATEDSEHWINTKFEEWFDSLRANRVCEEDKEKLRSTFVAGAISAYTHAFSELGDYCD